MSDHLAARARQHLQDGRAAFSRASESGSEDPDAESSLRAALAAYRRAMDWFEAAGDDDGFETAHSEMHEAGRLVRTKFGCSLKQEDEGYVITCPANLAHTRMGMSIKATSRRIECTVCDQEISVCPHIKGRDYDGVICAHRLMDLEVQSIDLVAYPAHPDARVLMQSVDIADLVKALGPDFEPGMPVSCDQCLGACRGIRRPFDRSTS